MITSHRSGQVISLLEWGREALKETLVLSQSQQPRPETKRRDTPRLGLLEYSLRNSIQMNVGGDLSVDMMRFALLKDQKIEWSLRRKDEPAWYIAKNLKLDSGLLRTVGCSAHRVAC